MNRGRSWGSQSSALEKMAGFGRMPKQYLAGQRGDLPLQQTWPQGFLKFLSDRFGVESLDHTGQCWLMVTENRNPKRSCT